LSRARREIGFEVIEDGTIERAACRVTRPVSRADGGLHTFLRSGELFCSSRFADPEQPEDGRGQDGRDSIASTRFSICFMRQSAMACARSALAKPRRERIRISRFT
jgi:hypothetical protein